MSAIGDVIDAIAIIDGEREPVLVVSIELESGMVGLIRANGDFATAFLSDVAANLHYDGTRWTSDFEESQ